MDTHKSMDSAFITGLEGIIDANLGNEGFGVNELAAESGLSRSQLHRKLKKLTGKSTTQFIREFRLEKAIALLQDNVATASEIAYRVGFGSPTYFNTSFTKYFGFPPGETKFHASNNSNGNNLPEVASISKSNKTRNRNFLVNFGIISLVVASLVWFKFSKNNQEKSIESEVFTDTSRDVSIAVLDFKNLSNDEENQYFTDGIREDIISQLLKIKGIVVKSRMSLDVYASGDIPDDKIGNTLKVDYLIKGSVQKQNDQIKIVSHLIDAKNGSHIWSESFNGKFENIFQLESQISRRISQEMNLILSPSELQGIRKIPTQNVEAHNLYLKGRYFLYKFSENTWELTEKYFNESIALDSEYALPYSGLAELYLYKNWPNTSEEDFKRAKNFALKAIELDGSLSETHRVLATIYYVYGWQWDKAETEFKKALELNPNNAQACIIYANFLMYIKGDVQKARELIDYSNTLVPVSYYFHIASSELYFQVEDYAMATIEVNKAKEIDPMILWAYWIRFLIYVEEGEDEAAIKELTYSWNLSENAKVNVAPILKAYEEGGIDSAFRWINDLDINFADEDRVLFNQNAYWIAEKFAFVGDDDKALQWLEIAYRGNNANLYRIKYDHFFKNLHSHPKFLELLKKMNLGNYATDLKL